MARDLASVLRRTGEDVAAENAPSFPVRSRRVAPIPVGVASIPERVALIPAKQARATVENNEVAEHRDRGPLISSPASAEAFILELMAASNEMMGRLRAEELAHLAGRIEQQVAAGGDVQPLLARARLQLGYAPEDAELLHASGGAVSVHEGAVRLGRDVTEVMGMLQRGEILAVDLFGAVLLPQLQFTAEGGQLAVLPGIPGVVAAAIEMAAEGWHVLEWLVAPSEALGGRTPIEALQAGQAEAVEAAAKAEV